MQSAEYRVLVRVDDPLCADDAIECAILALTPPQGRQLAQRIDRARELLHADPEFHHLACWNDLLDWYGSLPIGEPRDAITGEPVEEALETGYAILDRSALNCSAPCSVECATLHIHPNDVSWDAIPRGCDRHVKTYSVPHELVRAFAHKDTSEVRNRLRLLRLVSRSNDAAATPEGNPAAPHQKNSES